VRHMAGASFLIQQRLVFGAAGFMLGRPIRSLFRGQHRGIRCCEQRRQAVVFQIQVLVALPQQVDGGLELVDAFHALVQHQFELGGVADFGCEVVAQSDEFTAQGVDLVFQLGDAGVAAPAVAQMHGGGC